MRASPRSGVVDCMVVRAVGDDRSVTKAKCIARDVRSDKWSEVAMGCIPVMMQKHKVEFVRVRFLHEA